jgi:hypothetical protein
METLIGVVIGAILTAGLAYLTDAAKWRRAQRTQVVDAVTELMSKIWPDESTHLDFQTHLLSVRARLLLAGVNKERVSRLLDAASEARSAMRYELLPAEFFPDGEAQMGWAVRAEKTALLRSELENIADSLAGAWKFRRYQ